jgi:hypothetical protein
MLPETAGRLSGANPSGVCCQCGAFNQWLCIFADEWLGGRIAPRRSQYVLRPGRAGKDPVLPGHVSLETTERYLGCKQRFRNAVNDQIGIEPD